VKLASSQHKKQGSNSGTMKQKYKIKRIIFFFIIIAAAGSLTSYFLLINQPDRLAFSAKLNLKIVDISDGIPQGSDAKLFRKSGFILSYNEEFEQADWVAYILTRDMLMNSTFPRSNNFKTDTSISSLSANLNDYRGSGFDRGHLVPAADMSWSDAAMNESFLLSNISPQLPGFNRGVWKRLEEKVREWAVKNDSIYIISGPVLTDIDSLIGDNRVGIPKQFFKVIVDISYPTYKGIGFILGATSSKNELYTFAVSIDSIEHIINYDLFPAQDRKSIEYIEGHIDLTEWFENLPGNN